MNEKFFMHESSVIDESVEIGEGTKIWHYSHISTGASLGMFCTLGQNVFVGENVKIGKQCKIQNNVSIYSGVELEDYVFLGPSCVFTNVKVPRCKYPVKNKEDYLKTLVKEGASIGANATIVCGITLGKSCFIAAGAVVTKDVPDHAVIAGVPGEIIGWMCDCGGSLTFNNFSAAKCLNCKKEYKKYYDKVSKA